MVYPVLLTSSSSLGAMDLGIHALAVACETLEALRRHTYVQDLGAIVSATWFG